MKTPRLWHWPAVLGLDAPVVAVVWHLFLGRHLSGGAGPLGWALGFAVGALYLADRLVDLARRPVGEDRSVRHHWARHHPRYFGVALVFALVGMLFTIGPHWHPGLLFPALGVLLYGACFVWRRPRASLVSRLKKGVCGALFSAGVLTAVVAGRAVPVAGVLWAGGAFAGLCSANCLLIGDREQEIHPGLPSSPGWVWTALGLTVGLALPLVDSHTRVAGAIGLAAGALALLQATRRRFEPDTVRFLADACLLTPLFFL